jgi:hypothetical protein
MVNRRLMKIQEDPDGKEGHDERERWYKQMQEQKLKKKKVILESDAFHTGTLLDPK